MTTVTDLFCGAGGSSSGMAARGAQIRMAANHWKLAVESHNANFPDTDHDTADISQVDPRRYPRTDLLWGSPECTNHSQAKGRKRNTGQLTLDEPPLPDEAAERSRATMWDVVRFAEHHRYDVVLVENVVDAARWELFDAWWMALESLGYCAHTVFLNSMHAGDLRNAGGVDPAPQSRDRMYVVAHRKALRCPNLEVRPPAWCTACDRVVEARQSWKRPDRKPWGRYRAQYIYVCGTTGCYRPVEPYVLPAAVAIDWALAGERIGDRARPLADKTRARIAAGLARYARPIHLEAGGNQYDAADPKHRQHGSPSGYMRAWPADTDPLRTLHTAMTKGVAYAPGMLVPVEGRDGKTAASADEVMRTQTCRNETGLAIPPLVMRDALLTLSEAELIVDDCLFRMLEPHEIQAGMAFAADYGVLGNKREKVRQLGNAVTPPAAAWLYERILPILDGAA